MSITTKTTRLNVANHLRDHAELTAAELKTFAEIAEDDVCDIDESLNVVYQILSHIEDDYFSPDTNEDIAGKSLRLVSQADITAAEITACRRLLADACSTNKGLVNLLLADPEPDTERAQSMLDNWNEETNDPTTQEWRGRLTSAELALVKTWDEQYTRGIDKMYKAMNDVERQRDGSEGERQKQKAN